MLTLLIACNGCRKTIESPEISQHQGKVNDLPVLFSRGDELRYYINKFGVPERVYSGYVEVNHRKDIVADKEEICLTIRWEGVSLRTKSHMLVWFSKQNNGFKVAAIYTTPQSENITITKKEKENKRTGSRLRD